MLTSVGKILERSSCVTTEKYYGRIKDRAACDDMERAWKEAKAPQSVT